MKEIFNKLVQEFGIDVRKDPLDQRGAVGYFNGILIIYVLSLGLIDIYDVDSRLYLSCSTEEKARDRLKETIFKLKQKDIERKLKQIEKDFE